MLEILNRYYLHVAIGSFILLSSFIYGLTLGLKQKTGIAEANMFSADIESDYQGILPLDVTVLPMGKDIRINNIPAELFSFVSDKLGSELLSEQEQIWRARGLKLVPYSGNNRWALMGFDEATSDRYLFSAWTVPPMLRRVASLGRKTQGIMRVFSPARATEDPESSVLVVPEVPLMPGARASAVFSSVEFGARTYSSTYTSPADLHECLAFYRNSLLEAGWQESQVNLGPTKGATFEVANQVFARDTEEVVLLYTPSAKLNSSGENSSTLISVTRMSVAGAPASRTFSRSKDNYEK